MRDVSLDAHLMTCRKPLGRRQAVPVAELVILHFGEGGKLAGGLFHNLSSFYPSLRRILEMEAVMLTESGAIRCYE